MGNTMFNLNMLTFFLEVEFFRVLVWVNLLILEFQAIFLLFPFFRIVWEISHPDSWNIAYQECHIESSRVDWVRIQMQIQNIYQDQVIILWLHWDEWVQLPWIRSNLSVCRFYIQPHHRMDKRSLLLLLVRQKGSIQVAYVWSLLFRKYLRALLW